MEKVKGGVSKTNRLIILLVSVVLATGIFIVSDQAVAETISIPSYKDSNVPFDNSSAIAALVWFLGFQPFYMPSGSMIPTLNPDDRFIVSKLSCQLHPPQRGDIIVFKYPIDIKVIYAKRLIGLSGEKVQLSGGKLYINGNVVPEPYLSPDIRFSDFGPVTVSAGQYFVLGDNRMNSEDSRYWGFLDEHLIIGKAVFLYWPPNRAGILH